MDLPKQRRAWVLTGPLREWERHMSSDGFLRLQWRNGPGRDFNDLVGAHVAVIYNRTPMPMPMAGAEVSLIDEKELVLELRERFDLEAYLDDPRLEQAMRRLANIDVGVPLTFSGDGEVTLYEVNPVEFGAFWETARALQESQSSTSAATTTSPQLGKSSVSTPDSVRVLRLADLERKVDSSLSRDIMALVREIARDAAYPKAINSAILWMAVAQLTAADYDLSRFFGERLDPERVHGAWERYLASRRIGPTERATKAPEFVTANFVGIWSRAHQSARGRALRLADFWADFFTPVATETWPSFYELMSDCDLADGYHGAGFARFLIENDRQSDAVTELEAPTKHWVPAYQADDHAGRDQLGRLNDAQAMAGLIASKALVPPLAMGIFGPWGSGKSFFLQLIQQELRQLTQPAPGQEIDPAFWPHVVPITFNAWHYVDANLWASLISHILAELEVYSCGKPSTTAPYKKALAKLQLAGEASRLAQAEAEVVQAELNQAQSAVDKLGGELTDDRASLAAEMAKDVWDQVAKEVPLAADAPVARGLAGLRELHALQIEGVTVSRELRRQLGELLATGGRLHLLLLALLRGYGLRERVVWGGVLGGLGPGLAVALILAQFPQVFDGVFRNAVFFLSQAAGLAVALRHWLQARFGQFKVWLEPLEKLRVEIDTKLAVAEASKVAAIAQLKATMEVKQQQLLAARERVVVAEQAEASSKSAVDRASSGKHIGEFIARRLESGDYQRHLGVISMIRRDFETLSDMILGHNEIHDKARQGREVSELRRRLEAAVGAENLSNLGINRIVLFIDDLDRCPPEQVVKVLQATHLLLAFPVFTVVVAVDSRWVEKSLTKEYPLLLGEVTPVVDRPVKATDVAKPADYLEKIFQIPYWLSGLQPESSGRLLASLTELDREAEATPIPAMPTIGLPKPDSDPIMSLKPDAKFPEPKEERAQAPIPQIPPAPKPITPSPQVATRLEAASLRLSLAECDTIAQLAPVVGRSPRAMKRFINTYRLIKASTPTMAPGEKFRAVLFLLAVDGGAPRLLGRVNALIRNPEELSARGVLRRALEAKDSGLASETRARLGAWVGSPESAVWDEVWVDSLDEFRERTLQFSFERGED